MVKSSHSLPNGRDGANQIAQAGLTKRAGLRRLSPRTHAIAFRAWAWCNDHGWDHSTDDIAAGIGESQQSVQRVFVLKGWMGRVRKLTQDNSISYHNISHTPGEHALDDLQAWA